MKKRFVWLVVSCLMVLSLVLASCAPAAPTTPTAPTAPTTPAAPTPEKEVVAPGAEMVKDSLGRLVEKPKYGGVFTYAWSRIPPSFDNGLSSKALLWHLSLTNEELITLDWTKGPSGTGELEFLSNAMTPYWAWQGSLAESWEIPDEETVIFHIRKGIHWALNPNSEASRLVGGREFDANDVVATVTRNYNLDGKTPYCDNYKRFTNIDRLYAVKALDKWTVEVKIPEGYIDTQLRHLADNQVMYPPEPLKKYGDWLDWKNNVGTGPFILVDHIEGSVSTFIRNPNYWRTDPLHPENQLPYLDGVKMLIILDPSTRMAAFRTGKIDHLGVGRDGLTQDQAISMRTTVPPEVKELKYPPGDAMFISLRVDKPELPIYDRNVRRAIAMGIDRQTIIKDYYRGDALLQVWPVIPYKGWEPMSPSIEELPEAARELYEYHPDKAKQLLAEAGYPNGFKLEVLATTDWVDMLSIVKAQLAKIGVEIQIEVKERAVLTSIIRGQTHKEAAFWAETFGNPWVLSGWIGKTTVGVDDPYITDVRYQIDRSYLRDEPKAMKIMREATIYMIEYACYIEVPSSYFYAFWWPWLKGYNGEHSPGATNDYVWIYYAWLDQGLKKSMGF